jgi:hypothetical protein
MIVRTFLTYLETNGATRRTCRKGMRIPATRIPCLPPLCRSPSRGQMLKILLSAQLSFLDLGRYLQFFFVSTVDGVAEVIMWPAFLARSMRKSWISCRFGSSIVAAFDSWEAHSSGSYQATRRRVSARFSLAYSCHSALTFRPTWGEDLVVGLIDKDATSASVCLNDKKLPYSTCY